MDFYEEASLVMVPSGYKDQKVYSSVPDDGSGDLTFSRASTATRVNSDGYIEKAKVNLLLQSNSFDTTWTNVSSTETGGQSGYDGTNDAYKLDISAAGGRIAQPIVASGVLTASVYVKAGTLNWVRLLLTGSNTDDRYFNLSNGTLGGSTYSGGIDSKIEAVGSSGWYRISFTHNDTTATLRFYPAQANADLTATSGNIYIQDAQLNYGLVAQDYVETTTAAVTEGVAIDVPRLNYDPANPTSASLLLEPSRTNLIAQSEYINGWNKSGAPTITTNIAISPDGTTNASGIQSEDAINYKSITQNISLSANSTLTLSVFVKKETSETAYGGFTMYFQGGTAKIVYGIVDAVNGTVTYASSTLTATTKVEDYGNYWRISSTATDTGSNTLCTVGYYGTLSTNGTSLEQGIGSVRTIWGLQAEIGNYPTSYIPTYGTSATRTADAAYKTGISSLIGQTEGTLFAEFEGVETSVYTNLIPTISDGTINNSIKVYYDNSINGIRAFIRDGGNLQTNTAVAVTLNSGINKIAVSYKLNDLKIYINGSQIITDANINIPATSKISLFSDEAASFQQKIKGKQAILFTSALSASDLATLTSL